MVVFLERVLGWEEPLSPEAVKLMGETYGCGEGRNVEVLSRYFGVGLAARWSGVYGPTAELLGRVGRMKFVRPL